MASPKIKVSKEEKRKVKQMSTLELQTMEYGSKKNIPKIREELRQRGVK